MNDIIYKIRVNRPCYLYIDDEKVEFLSEMQLTKINLPCGRYIRKVVAIDDESIYKEDVITLLDFAELDIIELSTSNLAVAKRNALPDYEFCNNGFKYKASESNNGLIMVDSEHKYHSGEVIFPSQVLYHGYIYNVDELQVDFFNSDITSIVFSNGIKTIHSNFMDCYSLLMVTIPTSVSFLEENMFQDCFNLEVVKFLGTHEQLSLISPNHRWTWYTGIKVFKCKDGNYSKI